MNLSSLFEQKHKGKENAIKRKELLVLLRREMRPDISDRDMRKMYEELPLCGNYRGLFLPASEEEKQRQIRILNEKIKRSEEEIARLVKYNVNGRLF